MALIYCQECGKEISNKAKACIHCGCPTEYDKKANHCIINKKEYDLSNFKNRILTRDSTGNESAYQIAEDLCSFVDGLSIFGAAQLALEILQTGEIPESFDADAHSIKFKEDDGLVHCPRCDSTNIVTGQRGYSIVWGFVGSNRTMNRCAKCGHKWEPRR
jgi:DNA-directed RNA polymerase subunit M/transcription elongation factor TFIIS